MVLLISIPCYIKLVYVYENNKHRYDELVRFIVFQHPDPNYGITVMVDLSEAMHKLQSSGSAEAHGHP